MIGLGIDVDNRRASRNDEGPEYFAMTELVRFQEMKGETEVVPS